MTQPARLSSAPKTWRRKVPTVLITLLVATINVQAQETLALPGDALYPEGVVAAENGDLFVTGFGDGSVLRVTDGEVEVFRASGADGLSSAVGLALDEIRHRLWVANFTAEGATSDLKVYDVEKG